MRRYSKTKSGKYYLVTKSGYRKYYDSIENIEAKEKLFQKAIRPKIDLIGLIGIECGLVEQFSRGFKKVLESIEPSYTSYWISIQSCVDKAVINRILNEERLPSLQNFFRLLYFIENHIDNFNVWSLIDPSAPIQRTDGDEYEPFASLAGEFIEYRTKRNRKNFVPC